MTNISNSPLKTKTILIGILIVIVTTLSSQSALIGYMAIISQAIASIFILIYKPYLAVPYLMFSLGSCLEFSAFVNDAESPLYNLSNSKVAGVNIGAYIFILSGLSFFLIRNKSATRLKLSRAQALFIIMLILMYTQSIVLTIFEYFSQSSKLVSFQLSYIIGIAYLQLWPFALLLMFIYFIQKVENGLNILKYSVGFTLLATLVACLIVNTFGFQGTYGASPYYLAPTIIFLAPFFILIFKDPIFKLTTSSVYLLFACLVIIPILFLNLAGGKIILFLIISLLLAYKLFHLKNLAFILVAILAIILTFINMADDQTLMKAKIDELFSLINFVSGNWYDLLQPSTRFRVDEFINIYNHYAAYPQHIFSGFGIAGGAPDYIGGYGIVADGSFPQEEYSSGYFISYHEFSSFLIKYGLTGLIVISYLFIYTYKNKNHSQFLTVGVIWFLFFWGYSQTLAVIGAAILAVGVMEVNSSKKMKHNA